MEFRSGAFPTLSTAEDSILRAERPLSPTSVLSGNIGGAYRVPMKSHDGKKKSRVVDPDEETDNEEDDIDVPAKPLNDKAKQRRLRRMRGNAENLEEQEEEVLNNTNGDAASEITNLEDRDAALVDEVEGENAKSSWGNVTPSSAYNYVRRLIRQYPWVCVVVVLLMAFLLYIIYVQHQSGAKIQHVLSAHGLWFGPIDKAKKTKHHKSKRRTSSRRESVDYEAPPEISLEEIYQSHDDPPPMEDLFN